jgi:hypothetical protein
MKETKEIEKLIKQFAPVANDAEGKYEKIMMSLFLQMLMGSVSICKMRL